MGFDHSMVVVTQVEPGTPVEEVVLLPQDYQPLGALLEDVRTSDRKPNLVKLFTDHGSMYVDTRELANSCRTLLRIYTANGNRLSEAGRTKEIRDRASWGVHRDNLFATRELAIANRERIYADMAQQFKHQQQAAVL